MTENKEYQLNHRWILCDGSKMNLSVVLSRTDIADVNSIDEDAFRRMVEDEMTKMERALDIKIYMFLRDSEEAK